MRSESNVRSRCFLAVLALGCAAPAVACSGSAQAPGSSLPALSIPIEPAPPPPDDLPPPPPEPPAPAPQQPDPPALLSAEQYELDLVYERGAVTLRSAARRHFAQPVATARRMGRFAVELWVGEELVERVRFDFPLLAPPPPEKEAAPATGLDAGLVTSQKVLVPASDRARRAVLVDRSTGKQQPLPWPPITPAATAAAGAPDDASLPAEAQPARQSGAAPAPAPTSASAPTPTPAPAPTPGPVASPAPATPAQPHKKPNTPPPPPPSGR